MKRSVSLVAVLVVMSAFLLQACQPSAESGPLVVLIDNDEGPITPANFNTFIGYWIVGWVYDSLYVRDLDLNPVPALATEAKPSADGLTWLVTLRDDVKWHDGEPFTAEDVIFSYRFLIDSGRAADLAVIDSIEITGDHALTIRLKEPAPFFLSEALAGYYILPEHVWKDQPPASGEPSQFQGMVGTGAYRLTEVIPGESYTFEANEGYFLGKPQVPVIVARIVKDRDQQLNQLRAGEAAAVLSSIPPTLVPDLADAESIAVAEGSDFSSYVLYTNGSRAPFDQAKVREAISLAIDTKALIDTVMLGRGTELPSSYYHPDLPWAIGVPHFHDPDAARVLLDFAGLTDSDGDGIREWEGKPTDYAVLCDASSSTEVQATGLIIGWLEEVGIGARQNCLDHDTKVSRMWPNYVAVPDPDYDVAIWGWPSGPQSQRGFLRYLISDPQTTGWANLTGMVDTEVQGLLAEYVTTPDQAQREVLSQSIQMWFSEVLPMVPLMSPGGSYAYLPEKYDGWAYMKGTGIMTVWSFLPVQIEE